MKRTKINKKRRDWPILKSRRDDKSSEEIEECKKNNINVLTKRHLECYLLDDEIIELLCKKHDKTDKIKICLDQKTEFLKNKNLIDDIILKKL